MSILFRTFVVEKETNNQLTPKSRKGIQDMNSNRNYQTEIEDLLRRSTNDTIREILSAIYNERDQMTKLLDNGVPVFETAYGERFDRLYAQRRKLWTKVAELDKCVSIIIKHSK